MKSEQGNVAAEKRPMARMRTPEEINEMPGQEVVEKRTPNAKFFSLGENLYQSVIYAEPIHFQDRATGEWKEIDNTLEAKRTRAGKRQLVNRANGLHLTLSEPDDEWLVRLENEKGDTLCWRMKDAKGSAVPAEVKLESAALGTKAAAADRKITPMRRMEAALSKQQGEAVYAEILPGVDLRCRMEGTTFKDDVVFKRPESVRAIEFAMQAPGMTLVLREDKSISVLDRDGEEAFVMPAPFLVDAGEKRGEVAVGLAQCGDGEWELRYSPDMRWCAGAGYPVRLDPVVWTRNMTNVHSERALIYDGNPDTRGLPGNTSLPIRIADNDQVLSQVYDVSKTWFLIKYDQSMLPVIDSSHNVAKAYLCLTTDWAVPGEGDIYVRDITSEWSKDTVTYRNRPDVSDMYTGSLHYQLSATSDPQDAAVDITNSVRKWYTTGCNHGISLELRNSKPESYMSLSFYGGTIPYTKRPCLVINYVSIAGEQPTYAYETHDIGRAGKASVNLFNGNMVFSHNDTVTVGSRMPVAIAHHYNSCYANTDAHRCGKGWKHSFDIALHIERLIDNSYTGIGNIYYVLSQGDGARHYFKAKTGSTTEYEDMSGLSLSLVISGTTATIRDKMDNVMEFTTPTVVSTGSDGNQSYVKRIADAIGNAIVVNKPAGNTPTLITDGAGRVTTLTPNAQGKLVTIAAPGMAQNGVAFEYDQLDRLVKITHEDGAICQYAYDANNLLTRVTNHDGRSLEIEYGSTAPYRVRKVTEYVGAVRGNCREYTYDDCTTVVTDKTVENGKTLRYHFNDYGNVVSMNDELGFGATAQFSGNAPLNHPDSISKMQRSVVNLLRNPSFDRPAVWSLQGDAEFSSINGYVGPRCLRFYRSVNGQSTASQEVLLDKGGHHTVSMFCKRTGNVNLTVLCKYLDAQQMQQTLQAAVDQQEMTDAYQRVFCTFDLPENMGSNRVELVLQANAATGAELLVDAVQLEVGAVANQYNLLENGDFRFVEQGMPEAWQAHSANTYGDRVYAVDGASHPSCLPKQVLRLHGNPDVGTSVCQHVDVAGNANDVFVVGGWINAYSKQLDNQPEACSIRVMFLTSSGTTIYLHSKVQRAVWGEEWTGWQFTSAAIIAPVNYVGMRVYIDYRKNVNFAEFTGLFLHKEQYGWTYRYDNKGNVVSMQNLTGNTYNAYYDQYNNVSSVQHPGHPSNVRTYYGYSSQHLLYSITSPTNIRQNFTYDNKGNRLTTQLTSSGTSAFIKTTTAYTADQNHVASQVDARGKTVVRDVDPVTDVVRSVTDAGGQSIAYTYDTLRRVTGTTAQAGGKTYRNAYRYEQDRLAEVKHNTGSDDTCDVSYGFAYDALGNPTEVKVGNQLLSRTVYTDSGDKLVRRVEYGNGGKVHYERDDFKRVTSVRYDEETSARYAYDFDASGSVAVVRDHHLGRVATSEHDLSRRPARVRVTENGAHLYTSELAYDTVNRVSKVTEKVGTARTGYETTYAYDIEDRVTGLQYGGNAAHGISVQYDPLGRVTQRALLGTPGYTTGYTYVAGGHGANSTTSMVETIAQAGQNFAYVYNDVGYITSEQRNGLTTTYAYDGLGQLARVNDPHQNKSFAYVYDRGGNILSKTEHAYTTGTLGAATRTVSYAYGDSNWRDKLTAYNGVAITYDAIGNPLSDGTWQYTWKTGRMLTNLQKAGEAIAFAYDASGLRVRKTSTSRGTTEYTLSGKQIVHLKRGTVDMHFYYDELGRPGMVCYNGANYFYVYNLQGDVVALLDSVNKAQVVEYKYDAWGKPVACTGTLAGTLGVENPFRYRGYVFDVETGWYCTGLRYYNCEIGRFLNSDVVEALSECHENMAQYNLYCYCWNNPINMNDDEGCWPSWVTQIVAAAAIVVAAVAVAVVTVATAGAGTVAAVIAVGAAKGAAVGMVSGAAIGAATGAIEQRISTGSWTGAGQAALRGGASGALVGSITGAVAGGMSSTVRVTQAASNWGSAGGRSPLQNMNTHFTKHVLGEGHTYLGKNVVSYTNNAKSFFSANQSIAKLTSSGNYAVRAGFAGQKAGGFISKTGEIFSFF